MDSQPWELEAPALRVVDCLWAVGQQRLPSEIIKLDDGSAAIVVDVDGVDYILVMQRMPRQRPRPSAPLEETPPPRPAKGN